MKEIHNCLVIGGDMRQIYMAEALGQAGFTVSLYGFEHLEETNHVGSGSCRDYYEALKGKDAVIFPLPLSRDNVSLNAPFAGEEILLADILHAVESGQIVFGGMLGEREKQYLKHRGIEAFDYFAREELTVRNAGGGRAANRHRRASYHSAWLPCPCNGFWENFQDHLRPFALAWRTSYRCGAQAGGSRLGAGGRDARRVL